MAIPIINFWRRYFDNPDEGLGSSYERIILNNKLVELKKLFGIETVLEAPLFGFTGISGINSFQMAIEGASVTLLDHDEERAELIRQLWRKMEQEVSV
ncbi:MAG: hypothetical protein K8S56_08435, partial [Candidatus Cloacimonetes bacterium]|nr:hypothetical protein [Candidatus Cloacimonadota bacterium]